MVLKYIDPDLCPLSYFKTNRTRCNDLQKQTTTALHFLNVIFLKYACSAMQDQPNDTDCSQVAYPNAIPYSSIAKLRVGYNQ